MTGSVFRQLSVGLALVAGGLIAIAWLIKALQYVEMIINNGASLWTLFEITVLLIPSFLGVLLPIALFITVMFIYSKMTTDRELVVMSATGLSPLQLARPALILAGIITVLGYFVNFYILPETYRMFGELKWHIRYNLAQVPLEEGTFNTFGDKTTVYIRERTASNELRGIFVHDERDPKAPVTVMAKRGSLVKTAEGLQIVMFDGNRQALETETRNYSVLYFDRYTFPLNTFGAQKAYRTPDSREMTVRELFDIENNTIVLPRDYPKYLIEGHKRLVSPLVSIGFVMVALVSLFSGGFTRRNQNKRVVVATVVVLLLQISLLGVENMSARNLALVPSIYVVTLLPIIVGARMLFRPPRLEFLT